MFNCGLRNKETMKVKKIMTADVGYCSLEDNLTKAVEIMWQRDCGVVPIVDGEMQVKGMMTDRDICIAVGSRNQRASEIKTAEFVNEDVITCSPDDDLEDALKKMRKNQVRRLPVTSQDGKLAGILSITDILLKNKDLRKKVISALRAIGSPRPILLTEIADNSAEEQNDENFISASAR
jgi:CBS domain-containing protein